MYVDWLASKYNKPKYNYCEGFITIFVVVATYSEQTARNVFRRSKAKVKVANNRQEISKLYTLMLIHNQKFSISNKSLLSLCFYDIGNKRGLSTPLDFCLSVCMARVIPTIK